MWQGHQETELWNGSESHRWNRETITDLKKRASKLKIGVSGLRRKYDIIAALINHYEQRDAGHSSPPTTHGPQDSSPTTTHGPEDSSPPTTHGPDHSFHVHVGDIPTLNGMSVSDLATEIKERITPDMIARSFFGDGETDKRVRDSYQVDFYGLMFGAKRKLYDYLRALERFAEETIKKLYPHSEPRVRILGTETPFRDGSLVLYKSDGHYNMHHDAGQLRYPNRTYTFLAYIVCPGGERYNGGIEFGTDVKYECMEGKYLIWKNFDDNMQPDDRAYYAAMKVVGGLGAGFRINTLDNKPLVFHKMAINLWLDDKGSKGKRKASVDAAPHV